MGTGESDQRKNDLRAGERPANTERDRRGELIRAAMGVIAEKGVEGLRTRDISARAGVNISTLHYYFGTKETLLLSVLRHVTESLASSMPSSKGRSAREELRALFAGAFRSFRETPQLATVLQELRLRSRRDLSTRRAFRVVHGSWNRRVEEILTRGIANGELRADLDPRAAAMVVTSFMMGVTMQLWVNPKACSFTVVSKEIEGWLIAK